MLCPLVEVARFVGRTEAHAWKEPWVSNFFVYSRLLLSFSCPVSLFKKILRVDCLGVLCWLATNREAPIFSEYKCD